MRRNSRLPPVRFDWSLLDCDPESPEAAPKPPLLFFASSARRNLSRGSFGSGVLGLGPVEGESFVAMGRVWHLRASHASRRAPSGAGCPL